MSTDVRTQTNHLVYIFKHTIIFKNIYCFKNIDKKYMIIKDKKKVTCKQMLKIWPHF